MKNTIDPYYKKTWQQYPLKQRIRFRLEYLGSIIGFCILKCLGKKLAPRLCASVLSTIGRFLPITSMAKRNIAQCFPNKTSEQIDAIALGVWKNFGRVIGTYPFIQRFDTFDENQLILKGWDENLAPLIEQKKPILMFSAHIGNWEIISKAAEDRGLLPHRLYRPPSNPLVYNLFRDVRVTKDHQHLLHPAGKKGLFSVFKALKNKESIAVLADQRHKGGEMIPFFNRLAPTNDVIADLAIKTQAVIVPCHSRYLDDGRIELIVEKPLDYSEFTEPKQQKIAILTLINGRIESWIKENPEQWFWLHRRWSRSD